MLYKVSNGGNLSTSALKSLAQGFLVMTAAVWVFNVALLVRSGDAWLGLLYFLIFLLPLSVAIALKLSRRRSNTETVNRHGKQRNLLFSLQGVVLACWVYDLATTYYAIDVTGLATELNPLGWPLGILGALVYYGPTVAMMYVLLFKINQKSSVYVGAVLSVVSLWMGAMNFNAGALNFKVFLSTAYIMPELRLNLLALVVIVEVVSMVGLMKLYGSKQFMKSPTKSAQPAYH